MNLPKSLLKKYNTVHYTSKNSSVFRVSEEIAAIFGLGEINTKTRTFIYLGDPFVQLILFAVACFYRRYNLRRQFQSYF